NLNNSMLAKAAIWLVTALVLFTVFRQLERGAAGSVRAFAYTEFLDQVHAGHIKSVKLQDSSGGNLDITAQTDEGSQIHTTGTIADRGLFKDLLDSKVRVEVEPHEQPSPLLSFFYAFGPVILLIGVWIFFMRQMQGGGRGGAFSFGNSRARMLDENQNQVTFGDVAGVDEAKEEVAELVDFLRDPSKFQKLGGRIPRGVLMVGNPGTGKTLLAKAIAGDAKG